MTKTKGRRSKIRKGKKQEERKQRKKENKKKKPKKEKPIEVKKVAEEWEIWDEKEKIAKSKEETKKLVSLRFLKWIHVFQKKASEQIPKRGYRIIRLS